MALTLARAAARLTIGGGAALALLLAATLALPATALGDAAAAKATPADEESGLFALDAELSKETGVASGRVRRIRETPGVVTILTREELLASGARDLAEVLERVPGFQLGGDVENTVGPGFRGIWGNEGKVLFLLDGFELNDLSYGTFPLGNHVLIDQVDRIEIIRGPGSARYGGHAELAVVNVVTRAGSVEGAGATTTVGRVARATSSAALTAAGGATAGGMRFGATATLGDGVRSDRTYADLQGATKDMSDASRLAPAQVTARVSSGVLELRALYDDYRVTTRDGYGDVMPRDVDVRWRTAAAALKATLSPIDDVVVTPELLYRWEKPWEARAADVPELFYDVANDQVTGRIGAAWDSLLGPTLTAGVEGSVTRGRIVDDGGGLLSYAGRRSVTYRNVAAFAELTADTAVANVLAGVRVERHSAFGSSVVPRFALTKVWDPIHVKLLGSSAFRAPSIENVNYGDGLRPERTWVAEAEVGWEISKAVYATANVFDVTVERPIVFGVEGGDVYTNGRRTGTGGVETELLVRRGIASASVSWSFYTARGKNQVDTYAVPGKPGLLLGFAGHKVVATGQLRPLAHLSISPSMTFLSERWAWDGTGTPGETALRRIGPRTSLDLFASWGDLGVAGLELGVGLRDLLDQGTVFVQPYDGGHPPLPGNGREVWVRLRYERGE